MGFRCIIFFVTLVLDVLGFDDKLCPPIAHMIETFVVGGYILNLNTDYAALENPCKDVFSNEFCLRNIKLHANV